MMFKNPQFSEEEKELVNELESLSVRMKGSDDHKATLRTKLDEMYTSPVKSASIRSKHVFWIPSLATVFVLILAVVAVANQAPTATDGRLVMLEDIERPLVDREIEPQDAHEEAVSVSVQPTAPVFSAPAQGTLSLDELPMASSAFYFEPEGEQALKEVSSQPPTFRDTFIENIGGHTATVNELQEHGDELEYIYAVNLMAHRETLDVNDVRDMVGEYNGIVDQVERGDQAGTGIVRARIPVGEFEEFREELTDLLGERFVLIFEEAANRVADVIEIEKKVREVEDAIVILEDRVQHASTVAEREALEAELGRHRAYLEEREGVETTLRDWIDYAVVHIGLNRRSGAWQAQTKAQYLESIAGFEAPTFAQQMSASIVFVFTQILLFLAHVFWLVILLGGLWYWAWRQGKK